TAWPRSCAARRSPAGRSCFGLRWKKVTEGLPRSPSGSRGNAMFEWVGQNWWALWLTLFLVFAAVEMLTLDLFFIMLGGGALAGLVADFAGADLWLQIIAFCVVSLLMIGFVRPVAPKHL